MGGWAMGLGSTTEVEQVKREQLEQMANKIEQILKDNGARVHIEGGKVMPQQIRFRAILLNGTRPSQVRASVAMLREILGKNVCISMNGLGMCIEVEQEGELTVESLISEMEPMADVAVLGIAEDGAPLYVKLTSAAGAHILITGTGREGVLHLVTESLAKWNPADKLRVGPGYGQVEEVARAVEIGRKKPLPIFVVVLNEATVTPTLQTILERGPSAGVHVVMSTEQADIELRSMFPCIIRGRGNGEFEVAAPEPYYNGVFYAPIEGQLQRGADVSLNAGGT